MPRKIRGSGFGGGPPSGFLNRISNITKSAKKKYFFLSGRYLAKWCPENAPSASNRLVVLEKTPKIIKIHSLVATGGHFEDRVVYFAFLVASLHCVVVVSPLYSAPRLVRAQQSNAQCFLKVTFSGDQ